MGLLRMFLEFDILITLFLLEELAVPYLRDRRMFPVSRWMLGRLGSKAARIASKTQSHVSKRSRTSTGSSGWST